MKKRETHQCIKNKGLDCLKIFLFISFLLVSYAKQSNAECTLAITPISKSVPFSGGIFSLSVLSPTGCNWTSSENVNWISITSGSTGVGNGTVMYVVSSSTSSIPRSAMITVSTTDASRTHVVTQADSACKPFLTGNITESVSGETIEGAIIETDLKISTSSLPDGSYLMIHRAGTFNMIASKQGYCSKTHFEVEIPECDIKTEDFELQPNNLTALIDSQSIDLTINEGESVNFQGSATGCNAPFTYLWSFDGGANNSTVKNPRNVTFQTAGVYTIMFTVTDNVDDTDSDTVIVTVNTSTRAITWIPLLLLDY